MLQQIPTRQDSEPPGQGTSEQKSAATNVHSNHAPQGLSRVKRKRPDGSSSDSDYERGRGNSREIPAPRSNRPSSSSSSSDDSIDVEPQGEPQHVAEEEEDAESQDFDDTREYIGNGEAIDGEEGLENGEDAEDGEGDRIKEGSNDHREKSGRSLPVEESEQFDEQPGCGSGDDESSIPAALPSTKDENSSFEKPANVSTVTKEEVYLYGGVPMPWTIRNLYPFQIDTLPDEPNQSFSLTELKEFLGAHTLGSGSVLHREAKATCLLPCGPWPIQVCHIYRYHTATKTTLKNTRRHFPKVDHYFAIERNLEPLLPGQPGDHGAQIAAILQLLNYEEKFPLFIRDEPTSSSFRYYGEYREPIPAAVIMSSNEMSHIPDDIKFHRARQLGGKVRTRKVISQLKDTWPGAKVGWWDEGSKAMIDYNEELQTVDNVDLIASRPISDETASAPTTEEICDAFNRADGNEDPFVGLYYCYLECVDYDEEFYNKLVKLKKEEESNTKQGWPEESKRRKGSREESQGSPE